MSMVKMGLVATPTTYVFTNSIFQEDGGRDTEVNTGDRMDLGEDDLGTQKDYQSYNSTVELFDHAMADVNNAKNTRTGQDLANTTSNN